MTQRPLPLSALAEVPGLARNPRSRHLQPAKVQRMSNGDITHCQSKRAVRSPWVGTEPTPQANAAGEDEKEEITVTLLMYIGEASSVVRHICVLSLPVDRCEALEFTIVGRELEFAQGRLHGPDPLHNNIRSIRYIYVEPVLVGVRLNPARHMKSDLVALILAGKDEEDKRQ